MRHRSYALDLGIVALGAIILAVGGSFLLRQIKSGRELEHWMISEPAIQLILEKNPEQVRYLKEFFRGPYVRQGVLGLNRAKLDAMWMWNKNNQADYIWQYMDYRIDEHIRAELLFVHALDQGDGNHGICEQVFAGTATIGYAIQIAGEKVYLQFMKASEQLLLSARDGYVHPLTGSNITAKARDDIYQKALFQMIDKGQSLRPDWPLARHVGIMKKPDPKKSCTEYSHALSALLSLDPDTRSLIWRYQRFLSSASDLDKVGAAVQKP